MQSSKLSTGILLGMLLSVVSIQASQPVLQITPEDLANAFVLAHEKIEKNKTNAFTEAKKVIKKIPLHLKILGMTIGCVTIPYFMNYFTRKPLKEKRFDAKKLMSKEFFKHLNYFISDYVFGWPYKDAKIKMVTDTYGKKNLQVRNEQGPGGFIGKAHLYLILVANSLRFPGLIKKSFVDAYQGLEGWGNMLVVN
ncbi:hypothetical protein KAH94_01995 [bacterium]|nr:hypothetical protein [bacterium]